MIVSPAPFVIFYAGALLAALVGDRPRRVVLLAIPLVGVANLIGLPSDLTLSLPMLGYELVPVHADRLAMIFAWLFHIATFLGLLFSLNISGRVEQVSVLLYAGSALGAVFAADFITLFVFWEMLAVTSTFLVLARGTERSYRASLRYLIIQVLSGVILLVGILFRVSEGGGIAIGPLGLDQTSGQLILFAVGIKAGFPLLHNWLTDAYPESTPGGTVFLSAFTTKVAICVLARAFVGADVLIYVGTAMTCFPIFFAVIENDLRRVLSYSLINQLGFMVVGIGLGSELAVNGAISHAFNDVIFKGLLFMSMGAVLFRTGKINGSELGGLYKSMPWTAGFCIVGACSISAFPLFSGFVSKSMVMVAALEQGHPWVWIGLLFASAGVFHHAGIKIPFFAFFAHDSGIRVREAPFTMLLAMGISAAICIFNGVYPWVLYSMLPFPVHYEPYTVAHVVTQTQLLFFSALAFTLLKLSHLYPPELRSVNLDAEWVYRRLAPAIVRRGLAATRAIEGLAVGLATAGARRVMACELRSTWYGIFTGRSYSGAMVFYIVAMLAGVLTLYYV